MKEAPGAGALDPQTVAMVRVATATATGDEAALKVRMRAARGAMVPGEWMEELLLQSLLNVGYPLALVAFAAWRDVAGPPDDAGEPIAHAAWTQWERRGQDACKAVYGRTYHKLMINLRGLHPSLESLACQGLLDLGLPQDSRAYRTTRVTLRRPSQALLDAERAES